VVTAIDFSRTSLYLAIGFASGVCVFDLRNQTALREYRIECESIAFDTTGFLLGIAGRARWTCCPILRDDEEFVGFDMPGNNGRFGLEGTFFAAIGDGDNIDIIGHAGA
jgi:hypothetical protein